MRNVKFYIVKGTLQEHLFICHRACRVAVGNYWGDPSGPSGMGPGRGDSVGKTQVFAPFLTEIPEYCDATLGQKQ
jgi:hypothetical protein